jgi:hypothetical protein
MAVPCPYVGQPRHAKWRAAVGAVPRGTVDPTLPATLRITPRTRIVSAGSCFAQHVRAEIVRRGYTYHITERAPASLSADAADERGYGTFSARYGNVYSAPQLLQLFTRAYGAFAPAEDVWADGDRFVDPFRPFVEPDGFASPDAVRADREQHLAATRRAFEEAEVFVYTLGLTETWRNVHDGSVYPVCPGCGVASFDPARYAFVNLDVAQTVEALTAFLTRFAAVNPRAQVVLTVSPVPLLATMSGRHVVEANTYSKSVLRVAAEMVRATHPQVAYFPAYEIVTATHRTHDYIAGDGRTVTPAAVARVMDLFFQTYAGIPAPPIAPAEPALAAAERARVICDEETALALLDAPGNA